MKSIIELRAEAEEEYQKAWKPAREEYDRISHEAFVKFKKRMTELDRMEKEAK